MTTQIFIENATNQNFTLNDLDGHLFGQINGQNIYSLQLNYSENFEKQYNLFFTGGKLSFSLDINGEINRVFVFTQPFTLLIEPESRKQPMLFNKLIITPINNSLVRVIPPFAPPVPDGVLRLDF